MLKLGYDCKSIKEKIMNAATIELEYNRIITRVHQDPTFVATQNLWFSEYDLVGRTWFSLHSELSEMAKKKRRFLPTASLVGVNTVLGTLFNLWLEDRAIKAKQSINNIWIPISPEDGGYYQELSQPFVSLIKQRLAKPGNFIRLTVALLRTEIDCQESTEQFRFGTELAWRRWRELSTDA